METNFLIFTDLDGTLLDFNTYSYKPALPALKIINKEKIPLIICSSKTRAEIELYRKKLLNHHPFIVENGGAIYIPHNYFEFPYNYQKKFLGYKIIEIGTAYERLIEIIKNIKKKKVNFKGFSDMSIKEVSQLTELNYKEAKLCKKREYSEPFLLEENELNKLKKEIKPYKLKITSGGRFYHLIGKNDKGKAVRILKNIFSKKYSKFKTIGLGDSLNDFSMLRNVDIPVILKKINGKYERIKLKNLIHSDDPGPQGWNKIVLSIIKCPDQF